MAQDIQGITGPPAFQATGTPRVPLQSELGGLMLSQLDPDYLALSRAGKIFHVTHTVATGVIPLQVVPTTTAAFVLNNTNPSTSPKLCVPIYAGCYLASGTAGVGFSLWGQVGSTNLATQLTADGSGVTRGTGRGGSDVSLCYADTSKTVAGGWACLGGLDCAASTTPGTAYTFPCNGLFVVQPGNALGLHVLAGAGTTAKFSFFVIYTEVLGTCP